MTRKLQPVASDRVLDTRLDALEEETEQDLRQRAPGEARVNFRWGREQLAFVKRAAEAMGVPYQTYIKQAAFRQAAADLDALPSVR